jgi:hypothetical protein
LRRFDETSRTTPTNGIDGADLEPSRHVKGGT